MNDPLVFEVGSVQAMDGSTVRVGVRHGAVWIRSNGSPLSRTQAEAFTLLFTRAAWLAGQQDTP